jgi:predicted O-methyltransferase YrrM
MRAIVSFNTLTLLLRSRAPAIILARHFASRFSRIWSRLIPDRHWQAEVQNARSVFERNTRGLTFSTTWFDGSIPVWVRLLSDLKNSKPAVDILEIGSWEGRSTVFLLSFFPKGRVTAVDTWAGGDEYSDVAQVSAVERCFDANVAAFRDRVIKLKGASSAVLADLAHGTRESFDLIFVDGSHFSDDVMLDAVFSWRLLRKDGILIFDDYLWRFERYAWKKNPATAVNAFLRLVHGDYALLHVGYQLAIRKTVSIATYTDH